MEKVRLGRTNLRVKKMGCGGIPLQRVSEQEAIEVVQAVVEMGVDLLDTARGYTNSEYRIGLALKKANKPVILSSKSPCSLGKDLRRGAGKFKAIASPKNKYLPPAQRLQGRRLSEGNGAGGSLRRTETRES
ncbi:MAG: aldo/keto reductase [Deltaproteobacteria bacterium]|nr:aldo/keto reductase [Deltaproteobacteria bacterium]